MADEEQASPPLPPPPVLQPPPHAMPTIFGEVLERNVTFCVDTSGSMYGCLHVIKEQLIETLNKHAARDVDTMFNIIEFNSEVTQWADQMVACTPETVAVATEWISKLEAKTGTNTQDALLTALRDPVCEAVVLVTDGLPDQLPDDVLDNVVPATGIRPVHCVYLTGATADEGAVEFLEDLATETYGSFHVATLTVHGCVERVSPVYRADHTHERIIRTVNNTLRPSSDKACSVTTTLAIEPEETLGLIPRVSMLGRYPFFYNPYYPYWANWRLYPERYYYPYYWSRYRPAKAWLKAQDKLDTELGPDYSPAAGTLLIGKKVLARRIEDGYFYGGTVQSQLLQDKFLVAFGPCKHGKYKDTTYQETFVYDIIAVDDARRHAILTGDKVLAPWEPDGERYAPGIVIDGNEKRDVLGPDDRQLVVTFPTGKTERVAANMAVWLPEPMYDRLALELAMPKEARERLQEQPSYPLRNLPGYPTSGPVATPEEYPIVDPLAIESDPFYLAPGPYRYPPHFPIYPVRVRRQDNRPTSAPQVEQNGSEVIPGTHLTKRELEERISAQLREFSQTGDEYEKEQIRRERLLAKRERQEETTLKKSVSFNDAQLTQVAEAPSTEQETGDADSGHGTPTPTDLGESDLDLYQRDIGVNTDSSLLFRKPMPARHASPWRYWRNDPSPDVTVLGGGGSGGRGGSGSRSSSPGPFRETALQAPLEARDQRLTYPVEWTSPAFRYVDYAAPHDYSTSVAQCLQPHPPKEGTPPPRPCNVEPRVTPEMQEEARRALRRQRVLARQAAWDKRLVEGDRMQQLMEDQHRERVLAQIAREQQRQQAEFQAVNKAREAKKQISAELRSRIEANQKREADREEKRLAAMRLRRERREAMEVQKVKEVQDIAQRRQAIRQQHCQARHDAVTAKLDSEQVQQEALAKQHRQAKLNRINHFRRLEDESQKKKDLRIAVTDQHLHLYRSQIFP